jgi:hypothetical protein
MRSFPRQRVGNRILPPGYGASLENMMLAIHLHVEIAGPIHGFGRSQEKISAVIQRKVQRLDHPLLRLIIKVYQHVAAGDDVKVGKGRDPEDIMIGEKDGFA